MLVTYIYIVYAAAAEAGGPNLQVSSSALLCI